MTTGAEQGSPKPKEGDRLVDKIGQFTTIPNTVIEMWAAIGRDAFDLFVYLRYRSDKGDRCFPGYTLISLETGIRRGNIKGAIDQLEKHNLLTRKKRYGKSTIYTLHMPPIASSTGGVLLSSSTGGVLPVVRGVYSNQIHLNQTQRLTENQMQKPLQKRGKVFWEQRAESINTLIDAETEDSMDATKTQVRTTISEILGAYGIDNLEMEIKLTETVWGLAHPGENVRRPISPEHLKTRTLEAIHRGSTRAEEIRDAVYHNFHINVNWRTKTGKAFLEWLVSRQAEGQTVDKFAAWWKEEDWRGKQGQPPSVPLIYELWPQAFVVGEELGDGMDVFREAGFVIVGQ